MKKEVKNNEQQEFQKYISASVKVIKITPKRLLCVSEGNEEYTNTDDPNWFN